MRDSQNLRVQFLTWLSGQLGIVHRWVKDLWKGSSPEGEAIQPLLQIAGSLSGEPLTVEQIEAELYG